MSSSHFATQDIKKIYARESKFNKMKIKKNENIDRSLSPTTLSYTHIHCRPPPTPHTQRCIFYLKSANPLRIKLAHPDSSAQLPTLSHKTPGEICLQAKIQRTVKRTLDSWFQMKASTLLLPFLTYPPWTLPGSWDAQNCKAEFPFTMLCAGCCVGGKEHFLLRKLSLVSKFMIIAPAYEMTLHFWYLYSTYRSYFWMKVLLLK